jgi:hypothetical protein
MEAFAKQAGAVIDRPAVDRGFAIRLHTPLPAAA